MKEKYKKNPSGFMDWRRYLGYESIVKNIPFYLFMSMIAVIYIYNGHLADNLIRKIVKGEKNVQQLEFEYRNLKTEVIYRSKESELVKILEPLGLKEAKGAQIILTESNDTNKTITNP
ncbi:MAG: hypothetical protein FGM46_06620 [Ferruginibacter sp.]|nr:hypothetical protein [Ferruginibacter sp.]